MCLLTFLSSFLLITDRHVEEKSDKAAFTAAGTPTTVLTPVSDVATASEHKAAGPPHFAHQRHILYQLGGYQNISAFSSDMTFAPKKQSL